MTSNESRKMGTRAIFVLKEVQLLNPNHLLALTTKNQSIRQHRHQTQEEQQRKPSMLPFHHYLERSPVLLQNRLAHGDSLVYARRVVMLHVVRRLHLVIIQTPRSTNTERTKCRYGTIWYRTAQGHVLENGGDQRVRLDEQGQIVQRDL